MDRTQPKPPMLIKKQISKKWLENTPSLTRTAQTNTPNQCFKTGHQMGQGTMPESRSSLFSLLFSPLLKFVNVLGGYKKDFHSFNVILLYLHSKTIIMEEMESIENRGSKPYALVELLWSNDMDTTLTRWYQQ